ncbi:MAG: peptide deformylase [Boseongicola sp.]|nr:peptide deformylase [Boseongicola sp.]
MTGSPFIPWPDPRLQMKAETVEVVTDETRETLKHMVEVMDAMPGYGLAAPQIGILQRLAVVDCSTERGQSVKLINPMIEQASDELFEWNEASPNLPGVSAKIKRPAGVVVAFTDIDGNSVSEEFTDLWATSVQHQIDHLDGKMFFDRLSRTRRQMLLKKVRKASR